MTKRLPQLTLYTRADCPLCDDMHETILAANKYKPLHLEMIDVDSDPQLLRQYGERVPLLAIDGRIAFKVRIDPRELRRKLRRASKRPSA